MKFSLAALARRTKNPRRRAVTFRDIVPPATLASDLYAACYRPVIALWTARTDRILAEYERSLSALTTDSALDFGSILDAIGDEFSRLFLALTPSLRDWAVRVEKYHRQKFIGAALSASGVDMSVMIGPQDVRETLASYLAWNTDLIQDVSDQARKRISDAVFAGLTQRLPARDVAKKVREATGFARDRSLRIASDQLQRLTGELSRERSRQAGLDTQEWAHSAKLHPRQQHLARNGNLYSDNPVRVGQEIDGKIVLEMPPKGDRPSEAPYCGCRFRSVLIFD